MTTPTLEELIGTDAVRVLEEVRAALTALEEIATEADPEGELARNARLIREHVDEFFLLVVIGEVKSGKSSFINALLGETVQEEGPLPVTDRVWVLKHGEQPRDRLLGEF